MRLLSLRFNVSIGVVLLPTNDIKAFPERFRLCKPVIPVPVKLESKPFENVSEVSEVLSLTLSEVSQASQLLEKDVILLLLRLSDVSQCRLPAVIPKVPVAAFHARFREVTELPVHIIPDQLQTSVDVPHPVFVFQLPPSVFS